MLTVLLYGLPACLVLYIGLVAILRATQHVAEPPTLAKSVPFLEPVKGIMSKNVNYLLQLRDRHGLPIYTLRMPFLRQYILNSPAMIHAAQRQANELNFGPVARDFGFLFSGLWKSSQKTLIKSYAAEGNGFTHIIHDKLKPGPYLDDVSRVAIDALKSTLHDLRTDCGSISSPLYDKIRHQLTISLTDALYGPHNPFQFPVVEAAWQEFLPGIKFLLFGLLPSVFARRALRARALVTKAFQTYFENGEYGQASPLIHKMFIKNKSYGLPLCEIAKMEIATALAVLSSGAISSFWLIFHIYSDPTIVAAVRDEIVQNISSSLDGETQRIDLSAVRTRCPILHSTFQEMFRYHSSVISAKQVIKDTILDGYLLKKDAVLMIPGPVVHKDPAVWGDDVNTFNHLRFTESHRNMRVKPKKYGIGTSEFRPFGAGSTMCPGRHFSTNVILAFAVMMVLSFDVRPVEGEWVMPTKKNADLWNAMPKPDDDIEVIISPRVGGEKCTKFEFVWGV